MSYALVRGATITEYQSVPDALENISNFAAMPPSERRAFGFYEVIDSPPVPRGFSSVQRTLALVDDSVVAQYVVTDQPVEEIRAALWEQIKGRRQACMEGGVMVGGAWYHSDLWSRQQYTFLLMQGSALPSGIMWKRMDNTFAEVTPTLLQQIAAAMMTKELAAHAHGEALKAQVYAAADPRLVDLSVGWPESHQ